MNYSIDDFDEEPFLTNSPAAKATHLNSIKQENFIIGLVGVALVLASAWLPWW